MDTLQSLIHSDFEFPQEFIREYIEKFSFSNQNPNNIPRYGLKTVHPRRAFQGYTEWTFPTPRYTNLPDRPKAMRSEQALAAFPPRPCEKWSIDVDMWQDCPYGVALTFDDRPQAMISFKPHLLNNKSLLIKQIQGVPYYFFQEYFDEEEYSKALSDGKTSEYKSEQDIVEAFMRTENTRVPAYRSPKGLNVVDYKKLLVTFVEDMARGCGFSEIGIQRASNNSWVTCEKLAESRAEQIYDQTAKDLGYSDHLGAPSDFYKNL